MLFSLQLAGFGYCRYIDERAFLLEGLAMVDAFFWFVALVLFLVTLPGTIELALLTTAALLPRPKQAGTGIA